MSENSLFLRMPSFNLMGLPESEYELTRLLSLNLTQLAGQAGLFKTALDLADFCDATRAPHRAIINGPLDFSRPQAQGRSVEINRQFIEWKQLAARDGAITLYNFAETKQVLDKQKARCATIFPYINRAELKRANTCFDEEFAGFADIRLSVAHAGALSKSAEESARHRVPGSKTQVIQMLTDRRLTSSINHKMVHYELTHASFDALAAVVEHIYRAYEPAANFTHTLPRQAYWEPLLDEHRRANGKPEQG